MRDIPMKEIRKEVGLTQKQFSELFNPPIPIDTIKNWDCGRKKPPEWVKGMIIEKLNAIQGKGKNMKTLSYYKGTEQEIEIGAELYFGQLWDGEGDGEELLQSGAVSPDNENVVAFDVIESAEDVSDTLVKVTDIY